MSWLPSGALGAALLLAALLGAGTARAQASTDVQVPCSPPFAHDVRPGPGVTRQGMLSDVLPLLRGTPGDTPVFFLEGSEAGGTVVVVAGTHENELAGVFAALLLVEGARAEKGRLVVVPRANNSAVTHADAERPAPEWVVLGTESGSRRFRFGARMTNPLHQGAPDPPRWKHPLAEKDLPGVEARNLDRAFPGDPGGTLTQRIAFALVELLRRERADLAFDLHEAAPESRLAWMVVAHPRGLELAATAVLDLDAEGVPMKLERSDDAFRGLSHREWGDATPALSFLVETPNPSQVKGVDPALAVESPGFPLAGRVAVQLQTVRAIVEAHNATAPPERQVRLAGVPEPRELTRRGLGAFLR